MTYNNIDYYIINETDELVTLLKAEPLSIAEVNEYGAGHVNMHITDDRTSDVYQTAYDNNGYGGMAYYSSSTCGWNGSEWDSSECTTNYADSEVKYVVDAWTAAKTNASDLRADSTGYKARILSLDDLINNLGYSWEQNVTGSPVVNDNVLRFLIPVDESYWYWTMSQYLEEDDRVWFVN